MKIKYRFFTYVKIWYQFFTSGKNWYQFFTSVSIWYWSFTFVKIEYQFFTGVKNWYLFFTFVKIEYQFCTCVKNWYLFFTFVKIEYRFFTSEKNRTSPSQMARMRTDSSQLKMRRCEIWAQMLDPLNYRNWPYANFTFSKSEELVPILNMVWNLRKVKFAVQQSCLSHFLQERFYT